MSTHLVWDGDGARHYVRSQAVEWLYMVCIMTTSKAKELLSVPGTGKVRGQRAGPVVRSRPGEPPRKQTGRLRGSVTYEVDERALRARVGTNVMYGRYLELGTRRGLAPRPWLRPALAWVQRQLR